MQNLSAEDAGEEGDDYGEHHGDADAVAHISPHFLIVLRSEGLRHRDGEACTGPIAESHDEEHDGAGGSHGSQCPYAYPSTHDGCVDDEVHLLQNVSHDEGYRKLDDGSEWRANGHIAYILVITVHFLVILCL